MAGRIEAEILATFLHIKTCINVQLYHSKMYIQNNFIRSAHQLQYSYVDNKEMCTLISFWKIYGQEII